MDCSHSHPDGASSESRSGKLFRWVSGCSLVLCLLSGALWVRSVSVMDQVRSADRLSQTTLVSANGVLALERVTAMIPDMEPGVSFAHALSSQYHPTVSWDFAGFGGGRQQFPTLDGPINTETFVMPLWLVVVLFAVAPVLRWSGVKAAGSAPLQAVSRKLPTAVSAELKGKVPATPLAA